MKSKMATTRNPCYAFAFALEFFMLIGRSLKFYTYSVWKLTRI